MEKLATLIYGGSGCVKLVSCVILMIYVMCLNHLLYKSTRVLPMVTGWTKNGSTFGLKIIIFSGMDENQ